MPFWDSWFEKNSTPQNEPCYKVGYKDDAYATNDEKGIRDVTDDSYEVVFLGSEIETGNLKIRGTLKCTSIADLLDGELDFDPSGTGTGSSMVKEGMARILFTRKGKWVAEVAAFGKISISTSGDNGLCGKCSWRQYGIGNIEVDNTSIDELKAGLNV
ncbi:unnamed protein product [Rhizoctonia solani]|uniref:Uncharacterized protein n=1 Tax=Rhizoctonia solani TaxID=456999 RepID=A0A8H3H4C4_9AGAM|nr:unnamed protein product [Rhizoctonia solani]CAE6483502.1 unnamed protein product [Rhizoctonia solani]CAE6500037.1 unnamed protein product [Rhizoctonia solani]